MEEKKGFIKEITTGLPAWSKGVLAVAIIGGGAYGIYVLIKNLKELKEKKLMKDAELETSADNPWSYATFFKSLPAGAKLIKYSLASDYAKQVYDALNSYFDDDEAKAVGVFTSQPSQAHVAMIAEAFEKNYKMSILYYLKNGKKTFDFGSGGLSDEDYTKILENVKNKPKYIR